MPRLSIIPVALLLITPTIRAETCDAIRAQIDAKLRAAGVARYTLSTVDANAKVDGTVVGSCDLATRKIVYAQNEPPPKPAKEPILTECKDGSVSVGGDCKK